MKIMITGGTGFIGRNLLAKMSTAAEVCLVARNSGRARALLGKEFSYIAATGRKFKEHVELFNPELVIHLASHITSGQETSDLKKLLAANIYSGALLLDALSKCDVRSFVNVGSFSEYYRGVPDPDPAYLYSATKTAFRTILGYYAKTRQFNVIHVVPYSLYGPDDTRSKVLNQIVDATQSAVPVPMTGGEQVLDFIHILDVVDFFLALIRDSRKIHESFCEYHLGTGVGTSLRDVAKLVEALTGKKPNLQWGALPYRQRDIMRAIAPRGTAGAGIAWSPRIPLRTGLQMLIEGEKHDHPDYTAIPVSA